MCVMCCVIRLCAREPYYRVKTFPITTHGRGRRSLTLRVRCALSRLYVGVCMCVECMCVFGVCMCVCVCVDMHTIRYSSEMGYWWKNSV